MTKLVQRELAAAIALKAFLEGRGCSKHAPLEVERLARAGLERARVDKGPTEAPQGERANLGILCALILAERHRSQSGAGDVEVEKLRALAVEFQIATKAAWGMEPVKLYLDIVEFKTRKKNAGDFGDFTYQPCDPRTISPIDMTYYHTADSPDLVVAMIRRWSLRGDHALRYDAIAEWINYDLADLVNLGGK